MPDYILINAKTRAPVPLPYETTYVRDDTGEVAPARIVGFTDPRHSPVKQLAEHGAVTVIYNGGPPCCGVDPGRFGLTLITEEQFMTERD